MASSKIIGPLSRLHCLVGNPVRSFSFSAPYAPPKAERLGLVSEYDDRMSEVQNWTNDCRIRKPEELVVGNELAPSRLGNDSLLELAQTQE